MDALQESGKSTTAKIIYDGPVVSYLIYYDPYSPSYVIYNLRRPNISRHRLNFSTMVQF
jgi:hypothetical protein